MRIRPEADAHSQQGFTTDEGLGASDLTCGQAGQQQPRRDRGQRETDVQQEQGRPQDETDAISGARSRT